MSDYLVSPLLTGDTYQSDGVFTDDVKVYGSLDVDGITTLDQISTNELSVLSTVSSTSYNTGALLVSGGAGITGRVSTGSGFAVRESSGRQGTFTLSAGTMTVSSTVTSSSRIFLTTQSIGSTGTAGYLVVSSRNVPTHFTVLSSVPTDDSVVAYEIFEPA